MKWALFVWIGSKEVDAGVQYALRICAFYEVKQPFRLNSTVVG